MIERLALKRMASRPQICIPSAPQKTHGISRIGIRGHSQQEKVSMVRQKAVRGAYLLKPHARMK